MKYTLVLVSLLTVQVWAGQEHVRVEQKPLYEFGAGGGYFKAPYYQGSEQVQTRTLGIPFFIYRGKILKSDRDGGTRAEFYKEKNFRFDLSFSGGLSAKSSEIDARQGMPNLDWMGAVGPRAKWTLVRSKKYGSIKFSLPVRAVLVTDFKKTSDRGFIFHPNFTYNIDNVLVDWWDLFFRVGSLWAEERYMEYYYEVEPQFVTPNRPAYKAKAGWLENHIDVAAAFRVTPRWRVFLGLQYSQYNSVANEDSPLLTAKDTISLGLGIVWTMFESDERAGQWY